MAYTTIDKPTDYFETKLYSGNGGTQNITGLDFAPDWVWIKERTSTSDNMLYDTVRGATNRLESNTTDDEASSATQLNAFNSDGWTTGSSAGTNESGQTYVSWNWLAGGTASSNTDGSITSSVSANTTAGFSIIKFNTSSASANSLETIGHGLNAVPKMIILKPYTVTDKWFTYHVGIGNAKYIQLESTNAATSQSDTFGSTDPTSSVFSIHTQFWGSNSNDIIGYCFAEKKGYSKFGSYVGNGSSSGSYIHLGFKPALIITKRTDGISHWLMMDNKRDTFNVAKTLVVANESDSESDWGTGRNIDFLSNGFKARSTSTGLNISGSSYIFMAFAENPFVTSTGIPTTAR